MPGYEFIGKEEQDAINELFEVNNGYLYRYGSKAHYVRDFELSFSKYFKTTYAHAVSSGTSALKLSLQALGVEKGDEVITQAHTFIATVEAIHEVGAKPVIVDIDKSLNMNPSSLDNAITVKTKVVIPVHMSGVSCDMKGIRSVIEDHNPDIKILEDNAQSPGATYKGKYTGTLGDVGIFSFDYGKMLTTGEGGMVVTNDETIYKIVSGLSDHGHANNPQKPRGMDDCIGIGFNYKMNEIQGALGLVQLNKLQKTIQLHKQNKKLFLDGLKNIVDLRYRPDPSGDIGSSVSFFFENQNQSQKFVTLWNKAGYSTFNLPDAMRWHNACYWYHIPMITSGLMHSNELLNRCVAIPIKAKMSGDEIEKQIETIKKIIKEI